MIKAKIYTPINKLNKDSFSAIWKLLGIPVFDANEYDSKEPLTNEYDASESSAGFQLVGKGLIVKGNSENYLSARHKPTGLTHWIFNFEADRNELQIINLIKKFNKIVPIVFGMTCTEDEYDKKHKVIDEYSYGWEGTSMWDFQDFLPGIYWLNIFGKELSEAIDKEKINNLPNIKVANLDHGTILFHLDKPIIPESLDTRIEQEREIRRILGEQYFFDLEYQDEIEFKHPEKFKEYLVQLEKDY